MEKCQILRFNGKNGDLRRIKSGQYIIKRYLNGVAGRVGFNQK